MNSAAVPPNELGQFTGLLWRYGAVLIAVTIVVYAALLLAAILFWHRRHPTASSRHGNLPAEAAYVTVVAVLAGLLYFWSYTTEQRVDVATARPGLVINVTAAQWDWGFSYPQSGVHVQGSTQHFPTLVVPAGTLVRFNLTSRDVVHSFFMPAARFKRYAFPGRTSSFELRFSDLGTSQGFCAEFCGWGHDLMRFTLRVVTPAQFRSWLVSQPKGGPA